MGGEREENRKTRRRKYKERRADDLEVIGTLSMAQIRSEPNLLIPIAR